ncbi:uncharacterized protein [Macrobrachium rosenbergii]|uniref:uncharacterized protein n=1 Tax=Macrobrachium rosenbergii TaxID=79674 RepID=UPI0034D397CC
MWETHHPQEGSTGQKINPPPLFGGSNSRKNGNSGKPLTCHYCKKAGHYFNQCWNKQTAPLSPRKPPNTSPAPSTGAVGPHSPTHSSGTRNPPLPVPQSRLAPPGCHKDVKFLPVPPDGSSPKGAASQPVPELVIDTCEPSTPPPTVTALSPAATDTLVSRDSAPPRWADELCELQKLIAELANKTPASAVAAAGPGGTPCRPPVLGPLIPRLRTSVQVGEVRSRNTTGMGNSSALCFIYSLYSGGQYSTQLPFTPCYRNPALIAFKTCPWTKIRVSNACCV